MRDVAVDRDDDLGQATPTGSSSNTSSAASQRRNARIDVFIGRPLHRWHWAAVILRAI